MAFEIPGFKFSLEASGDLSASQFRFVTADANGQAAVAGAGVPTIGVLQDKPSAAGIAGEIMGDGITKVVAGAAVTAGAQVMSDATGRAVTATTGNHIAGQALETAANAGEIISVFLKHGGQLN